MFGLLRSPNAAVCLIGLGALFMFLGHKHAARTAALSAHGKTADAQIVKLDWREKKRNHEDSDYTAHIRFTTEAGQEIRDEVGVSTELGRALRSKSGPAVLTVRYLPEDPHTLDDVNKEDFSDAERDLGRYVLLGGIAILVMSFIFPKRSR
ncbi:DUF3592 domain-containing protein [Roseateles sp. BYS96W]|uniref:DUF3592 domain-containing protein n=1 Tax=Pelomonas nitida TaxID=3299027 RepID=A0ABW7G0S6_9BURK